MKLSNTVYSSALLSAAFAQSNITCQSGLHVIVARASYEPQGFGILGPVKDQILAAVPNSDAIAVTYPATIVTPAYFDSESEGVGNLTQLITQYGDACPGNRMALLGYSQGSQVIGDTVIGVGYTSNFPFRNNTALDAKYRDSIVAIIMMGDPANVAGQPFLVGNSTKNGTFPRQNTADWVSDGIVGKIQSYCTAEDTFCDSGNQNDSLAIHLSYISQYGNQSAEYVISKANGNSSTGGNGTSNGSGTSTTSTSGLATTSTPGASSTSRNPSATTTGSGPAATSSTPPNGAVSLGSGFGSYVMAGALAVAMLY